MKKVDKEFSKIWDSISSENWQLICEMEAITHVLASYALCESQMDDLAASKLPYFRYCLQKTAEVETFAVLDFMDSGNHLHSKTTVTDMHRLEKMSLTLLSMKEGASLDFSFKFKKDLVNSVQLSACLLF
jgi:hypothetical protein